MLNNSAGGRFVIDATTGVVTVANGGLVDFEDSNTYAITVTATSGALINSRVFTIGVTDINDNAPAFVSGATANAQENVSPATTAYLAQVTDADGTAPNNTISYSVTGTDAGLFDINSSTGAVTFKAAPDFEAPADANNDNNYQITVHANDGLFDTTRT